MFWIFRTFQFRNSTSFNLGSVNVSNLKLTKFQMWNIGSCNACNLYVSQFTLTKFETWTLQSVKFETFTVSNLKVFWSIARYKTWNFDTLEISSDWHITCVFWKFQNWRGRSGKAWFETFKVSRFQTQTFQTCLQAEFQIPKVASFKVIWESQSFIHFKGSSSAQPESPVPGI